MTNRILELKEQVYEYVNRHGPVLPAVIAKEFRSTNIFISALLSELISNKRIKLTRAKIGGSPLYYCKDQEARIVELLRGNLGQKQREALDILIEKKVLRDRDCLPFERVALRELEDFAIPVKLVISDVEEIFWKWYLLPDQEAKESIEKSLERIYAPKKEEAVLIQVAKTLGKTEEKEEREREPILKAVEKQEPKRKKKKFLQEVLLDKGKIEKSDSDFESIIIQYLKKKEIKILDKVAIAKNKELNFTVQIPSNAGDLTYFVKARYKKSLSEGDLLLAFTEGQNLKLPTLYLSSGDITKKAREYMIKNLKGMNFIKIK
ncbi:MAG TPA: hypothetical protein HA360_05475 [Nanoarchaeota archaeon]|nr:hypothetical protein [Candidatus Woesearchaeota archaeon]HIH14942.1 hypothetical protein [Nanoarchaeota archaeon]HIH58409.1 hypothetical protein [Nanoarchaeota archaeon]HII14498.1 hypothetical protein [Nanoarchaeota archaeon]HIJ05633.1 hypothetical protein [Nanoarchaeota archaeon]